jgi:hypothetical protein
MKTKKVVKNKKGPCRKAPKETSSPHPFFIPRIEDIQTQTQPEFFEAWKEALEKGTIVGDISASEISERRGTGLTRRGAITEIVSQRMSDKEKDEENLAKIAAVIGPDYDLGKRQREANRHFAKGRVVDEAPELKDRNETFIKKALEIKVKRPDLSIRAIARRMSSDSDINSDREIHGPLTAEAIRKIIAPALKK